jgi:peptidoglycan/xylan/chitin deacetylase (PgdA/CDA1 family)
MSPFIQSLYPLFGLILFAGIATAQQVQPAKHVAMVFDDGPIPGRTEDFLAVLAKEQVHVTFSHIGQKDADQPALAQRVVEAGHEVINHSNTHPHFKELSDDAIKAEVKTAQEHIAKATGCQAKWYWAPYGDWDDRIRDAVRAAGLEHYPVSDFKFVSTDDWDPKTTADQIRTRATTGIGDRTIILFHEFSSDSLVQLPAIIAELKKQGCRFLTFSELVEVQSRENKAKSL